MALTGQKKINGSEIVGGGNSRSGVACGSAVMHHCCSSFKDAARDLLRLLLSTSAARVQFRSDADGSWSRPTSFLRDRRGVRFHLLTFWAAIADVRFWSPAFMRTFLRTCQPKRLLQRLRAKIAV